ncbi:hypothetical protein P5F55_13920 [Clostridium perfringens]|uniref:hypothetical protein n=1 Tax=Clostridium perfringens TaxID=1502 RepID=UPI0029787FEE|nr:hypothetical protein [Clostridium perfringens]MDK0834995.1 hypothetical protein [Clostridium perfringens]MDK0928459.1 hypothetical protein [Clostridium perfringens]MDM0495315.1 hypothetical protein [Clostridium perfringens]MDM0781031.1 hypothetical protein [Clostridium perfringens]
MSGEFLLVTFQGEYGEAVKYCGCNEIEALKLYKQLKTPFKHIVRANVKRRLIRNTPFIMSYDVIEVLK